MDFNYQIIFSKRKTATISVERDRKIIVRVPEGLSDDKINEIVLGKEKWILEKLNHNQKYNPIISNKEFVSGETLNYLGRNYQLQIVNNEFDNIIFDRRFLISKSNQEIANRLFKEWYKTKAVEKIKPIAKKFAKHLGVEYKEIKISEMKYRWGSCTPNGNLLFNWRIIKAPMYVVEYVIVHELAHLIEHNHSVDFWNIVSVQLPNFDKAKEWLKLNGEILEIDF
ncbi:M48 family metallopeptidase [Elizabethkingia miricola]|uniref:M48 family metallopeptidase n=1 Tax=Elizabethkingia miricola TaxID=172045 RepID=UPI002013275B|nr:SprT family zinc-dependent metalloprotease [Elizabethkingia miricola]MCL1678811.1 M48 family metallopeptidase [Elizabethkingia miricola]